MSTLAWVVLLMVSLSFLLMVIGFFILAPKGAEDDEYGEYNAGYDVSNGWQGEIRKPTHMLYRYGEADDLGNPPTSKCVKPL